MPSSGQIIFKQHERQSYATKKCENLGVIKGQTWITLELFSLYFSEVMEFDFSNHNVTFAQKVQPALYVTF